MEPCFGNESVCTFFLSFKFQINFLIKIKIKIKIWLKQHFAIAQLLGLPKGVSEQIEKMLELFPGQPADEKTMQQLWEYMQKNKSYQCFYCEGAMIQFKVQSCYHSNSDDEEEPEYEGDVLHMWLMGPVDNDHRATVGFLVLRCFERRPAACARRWVTLFETLSG